MKTVRPLHVLVLATLFLVPFVPGACNSTTDEQMDACKKMCAPRLVKEFKSDGLFSAPSCVCEPISHTASPDGGQGR